MLVTMQLTVAQAFGQAVQIVLTLVFFGVSISVVWLVVSALRRIANGVEEIAERLRETGPGAPGVSNTDK